MPQDSSIFHDVRLIAQKTRSTCWAASTAMLIGSTEADVIRRTPRDLIGSSGGLKNYSRQSDWVTGTRKFALAHGLQFGPPQSWSVDGLHDQLSQGPIMIDTLWNATNYVENKGSPGHMIVLIGMSGEGSSTTVTVNDPWRPNVGRRYTANYYSWVQQVPTRTYRTFWT